VGTENVAFRFEWVPPVLWDAATNDRIPRIAMLTETVQNPKRPVDSELGYMTGFWIGQYVESEGGREAVVRLLKAYSEGKPDDEAFNTAVGMGVSEFEPKFHAWAKELVKPWGYDEEATRKYKALVDKGDEQTKSNQYDEAIKTWTEAHALQPMNLTPRRRLAGLYLKQGKPKEALPHLEAVVPLELSDNRFSKRIARIYRDAGDLPNAIKKATEAIYIAPYDPTAHELLAELHDQSGEKELAVRDRTIAEELKAQQDKASKERIAP
jgi:tetratricopeptide (TPR) repeat protein